MNRLNPIDEGCIIGHIHILPVATDRETVGYSAAIRPVFQTEIEETIPNL